MNTAQISEIFDRIFKLLTLMNENLLLLREINESLSARIALLEERIRCIESSRKQADGDNDGR